MWTKHHLEDIVMHWYELGVQLDVPNAISKLNEIRCNNSSDVYHVSGQIPFLPMDKSQN